MLQRYILPAPGEWPEMLKRPAMEAISLHETVRVILKTVQEKGDQALKDYGKRFDLANLEQVIVSEEEVERATDQVSASLKEAIRQAAKNIHTFHESQVMHEDKTETMPGVVCWREARPIEKVGLYIPGGTAPLFSTVLMLAIPAQIAGCSEIILCSPPNKKSEIHPAILYAARLAGVHRIVKAGGAQAIAAMAYGTESVPRVSKIFGPGNQYVTAAKQLVSLDGVAIDMPAGPSEVAVIADSSAKPEFVAIDLLSQAEHGNDSQVVLIATSESMVDEVEIAIDRLLNELSRGEYMRNSLLHSKAIVVESLKEAANISNAYCPEHLILAVDDPYTLAAEIINAGSVFMGHYTPESAGDYASGTNHTLPTNGAAAAYSGVSLDSFIKKITFQDISREGLNVLGPIVEILAEAEELTAHKMAVTLRLKA
jgi:histidinol dehydrogenase